MLTSDVKLQYYQHLLLLQSILHQSLHIQMLLQVLFQLILNQLLQNQHLFLLLKYELNNKILDKIMGKWTIYLKIYIGNKCMEICIINNITIKKIISQ